MIEKDWKSPKGVRWDEENQYRKNHPVISPDRGTSVLRA